MSADSRRPERSASSGPLEARANASPTDRRWALYVVQEGTGGPVGAMRVDSLNPEAVAALIDRARRADGAEGEDIWQVTYEGKRGAYANGYGCLRARTPAHADAAEQVAFRCQCHSSRDGTTQSIFEATLSDNTAMFQVRANGECRAPVVRYLDCALGTNITSRTSVTVATFREVSSFRFRGTLQWPTGVTIAGGTTLLTVNSEHIPATEKSWSIRAVGAGSNVSTTLHLAGADSQTPGALTNEASLGTSSGTVHLPLDGLSYDPS